MMLSCYLARACISLSFSLTSPSLLLLAARRGRIKCYFIAAARTDKERLFCLFQIKYRMNYYVPPAHKRVFLLQLRVA